MTVKLPGKLFNLNKYVFRQTLLGACVTMDAFLIGAGYTYSATLLPQLEDSDSAIKVTRDESTWLASIISLMCVPGTLMSFILLHSLGRKWFFFIIALSNVIAWLLIAGSHEYYQLLAGRALHGLNIGLSFTVCFCYIVEVVYVKYRSTMINMISFGTALGNLFSDVMGTYLHWQVSAYVLAGIAALYCAVLIYLKNTHAWYLQHGDPVRARELFFWYKKETQDTIEEFKAERNVSDVKVNLKVLFKEWTRREFLLPLGINTWFTTTVAATGGIGIMFYSVEIMEKVVDTDEYLTTVIMDIIRIVATLGTLILLRFISVRLILNISSVFIVISLLVASLAMYLEDSWSGSGTLALVSLLVFNIFFNSGYLNIGNICIGELFTGIGKNTGTVMSGMYMHLTNFAYGQLMPIMFDKLGYAASFLIFGICATLGAIGLYYFVPETKDVSNEQIRLNFKKKRHSTDM